ncbi:MAG: hypothetical protein GX185_00765 [Tissierellia bacterium]|nr:hypothetical protein [Tissierellia bacterium]
MSKEKSNLTLKIFSVIIAIILWSYVMGIKNPDWPREYKNIDVQFTNIEALERRNLILMDPKEAKVTVSVVGKKSDMDKFTANNIVAKVDLSGYGEGQTKVPVVVSLKDSASTVRITKYEPTEILVTIDRIVTEERKVNIRTSGELDRNYTLGDIEARPDSILLKGPRSWLNEVSEVFVVVPINNTTTTSKFYPVQIVNHNGDEVVGVEKLPGTVEVIIPVYRKASLPIEVVLENQLPEDYVITNLEITPKMVAVRGGNSLADIRSIKTRPIDVTKLLENPSLDVDLELPDNVDLIDPNQRIVINATIEQVVEREFIYDLEEVEIRNLGEDLVIEDDNLSIRVQVRGTESLLNQITKSDLRPYIDLDNFTEGEYEVKVNFHELEGISIEKVIPDSLKLVLIGS